MFSAWEVFFGEPPHFSLASENNFLSRLGIKIRTSNFEMYLFPLTIQPLTPNNPSFSVTYRTGQKRVDTNDSSLRLWKRCPGITKLNERFRDIVNVVGEHHC